LQIKPPGAGALVLGLPDETVRQKLLALAVTDESTDKGADLGGAGHTTEWLASCSRRVSLGIGGNPRGGWNLQVPGPLERKKLAPAVKRKINHWRYV
jgi:hypothetical protein